MNKRAKVGLLTLLAGLFTLLAGVGSSAATNSGNPNDASYWEVPGTQCYKHVSDGGAHGSVIDGAVVLNTFDQAWFGDHWALLIVKGGAVDYGYGAGNAVFPLPTAGTPYYPPLNGGGQVPAVSHWIVCKGETQSTTTSSSSTTSSTTSSTSTSTTSTTTSTTLAPTTSTTEAPTTSSTVIDTTTTAADTTTSTTGPGTTVPPSSTEGTTTTTTVDETSSSLTVPPSTTGPATSTIPPDLPKTGSSGADNMLAIGFALIAAGSCLLVARRRA